MNTMRGSRAAGVMLVASALICAAGASPAGAQLPLQARVQLTQNGADLTCQIALGPPVRITQWTFNRGSKVVLNKADPNAAAQASPSQTYKLTTADVGQWFSCGAGSPWDDGSGNFDSAVSRTLLIAPSPAIPAPATTPAASPPTQSARRAQLLKRAVANCKAKFKGTSKKKKAKRAACIRRANRLYG